MLIIPITLYCVIKAGKYNRDLIIMLWICQARQVNLLGCPAQQPTRVGYDLIQSNVIGFFSSFQRPARTIQDILNIPPIYFLLLLVAHCCGNGAD